MLISDDRKEATGLVARMDGDGRGLVPFGADRSRARALGGRERRVRGSAADDLRRRVLAARQPPPRRPRRGEERRLCSGHLGRSRARRSHRCQHEPPANLPAEEIARLEALAGETALALEKTRSAAQLEEALGRERLVAEIARRVRSEHDVGAVLRIAVEEVGKATDVSRCFIRLGEPGAPTPIRAEWESEGLPPIGADAPNLAGSNLAMREGRTVAIEDVEEEPRLEDPSLGGVDTLLRLRTRAILATPIQVFDRMIGVFALHCSKPTEWTQSHALLVEAVAREVGLALHTAELLEENRRRLGRQAALVQAAQVMTSELEVETVLQRLVVEVTKLLEAEAADCYLFDSRRGVLRCSAVYGLPAELVEFEFPAEGALAGEAMRRRQAVVSADYEDVEAPHPAYEGFTAAMVAPMTWWGEVRGVIGVGTTDRERRFSREDVEVLEAFASLGSVALRNLASIEQSSRQVRIQRGFFRIASVLAQPLSLDETLDAVAQAASEALGGSFGAVLMPGEGGLRLAGSHELPPAVAELFREGIGGAEALEDAAARKQVLASPELADDDRFGDDWRALADAEGARSLVAVPVEAPRREQTGIGLVFFAEEQAFSDDEIELAHHLAGAARGALERAELFEAERRNRAIAQQLARTGTLLASELDPDAILEEIVAQAPGLVGADAAAVSVFEGDELVVSAAHGEGAEAAIGSRVSPVGELAGEVVQSRGPVAARDARADGLVSGSDALLEAGYAGYLGAPLLGPEGGVHGVLAVYAREARSWREEEVEALAALAGNVSAFLSNAELYQRVVLERERSLAILGNVADGIVAVDREGNVVLWNSAAEEITDVPASEAMGRSPADVLQRSLEADETSAEGRGLIQIRRGEEEVWLSVSEAVMRDPAGVVSGRIYAFRDVSSDRLVEQLKSGFVSTVSHELRAPLTSIYGFAETLLREDVAFGEDERRIFLGYIATEAQRLTGIVDALLSVARLESGRPSGAVRADRSPRGRLGRGRERRARACERAPVHRRDPRGAARRVRRPGQGPADPRQPRRQRAQVLPERRHGDRCRTEDPRCRPGSRRRRGQRRPAGRAGADLQEVLPRRGDGPAAPAARASGCSSRAGSRARWAAACGSTPTPEWAAASSSSCR